MGPRSFDRGKLVYRGVRDARLYRFNGAAIFRSRKVRERLAAMHEGLTLQWGRDLSIAESRCATQAAIRAGYSLQWGRDLSIAERWPLTTPFARPSSSFNGAAIFRSRKDAAGSLPSPQKPCASMGPRSFDRGKRAE